MSRPAAARTRLLSSRADVWRLRVVGCPNLLGAVPLSFREQVRHHETGDRHTPYLLTAGFSSAAFAVFLAVMTGRRKRAAWIADTVLASLLLIGVLLSSAFEPDIRTRPFNGAATAVSACYVAVLLGRREFQARGGAPSAPAAPRLEHAA